MGGNSLSDLLVFGKIAGEEAAKFALSDKSDKSDLSEQVAKASQVAYGPSFDVAQRRVDGSEKERADEAYALESFADDARAKRVQVKFDIGQFGHAT